MRVSVRTAAIPVAVAALGGWLVQPSDAGDGRSHELISEQAARAIAARSGWHPARVTARLAVYRPHRSGSKPSYRVWIVHYAGGDVCLPLHGPRTNGWGIPEVDLIMDARSGRVIAESSGGYAAHCWR